MVWFPTVASHLALRDQLGSLISLPMPELPWVKWFPTCWASEPGLRQCETATRAIWFEAINTMFLQSSGSVSGTIEELALMLHCRTSQMHLALAEMRKFKIADVSEQNPTNDEQNIVFTIICRRNLRTTTIKHLRINAGRASGISRRTKVEQTSTSTSTSTSLSGKGVQGEGVEDPTFESAMAGVPIHTREQIGKHLDFAKMVFDAWDSVDGRNGAGVSCRFEKLLKKRWDEEGEAWANGCHSKQLQKKKAAPPLQWTSNELTAKEKLMMQP